MGQARFNKTAVIARMHRGARIGLERAAIELVNGLKQTLSKPGQGKLYKTGKSGGVHRASAPGQPPAARTGALRRWILIDKRGLSNLKRPSVMVKIVMKYAKYLEPPAKLNRPFAQVTRQRMDAQIQNTIRSAIAAEFRRR